MIQLFRFDATSENIDQTDALGRTESRKALDDLLVFKKLVRNSEPGTKAMGLLVQ